MPLPPRDNRERGAAPPDYTRSRTVPAPKSSRRSGPHRGSEVERLAGQATLADPRQRLFALCLVAYGLANWLILAASEGNVGNLLRHRLMLDPVLLIFGGAGLEWLWVRAGRPFSTRLPGSLIPAHSDG